MEKSNEKQEAENAEVKRGRGRPKKASPLTPQLPPSIEKEETPTVNKSREPKKSPLIPATTQIPSNVKEKKLNVDAGKPVTQTKKRNKKYRLYEFKSCEGTVQCMSCKQNAKLHPTQDLTGNAWIHLRKCQKRKWNKKTYSRKNIVFVSASNEETTAAVSNDAEEVEAEINEDENDGVAVSQVPDFEDLSGYHATFGSNHNKGWEERVFADDDDEFVLDVHSDEIESSQEEQSTSSLSNDKEQTSQDATAIFVPPNDESNMTANEQQLMVLYIYNRRWQLFGITSDDATNVRTPGHHLSVNVTFRILHRIAALRNRRCNLNTRFAVFHPTFLGEEYSIMPDNKKVEHIKNSVFFADEGRPERFMLPIHRHEHFALVVFGRDENKHVDAHLYDPNFEQDRRIMITIAETEEFAKHYYGEVNSITFERGTEEQVEPQKAGSNDSGVFLLLNATRCFVENYVPLGNILKMKRHNLQIATEISEVRKHYALVTERIFFNDFLNALMFFTPQPSTNSEECIIEENVKELTSSHEIPSHSTSKQHALKRSTPEESSSNVAKIPSKTRRSESDTPAATGKVSICIELPHHNLPGLGYNAQLGCFAQLGRAELEQLREIKRTDKCDTWLTDSNIDFALCCHAIKHLQRDQWDSIWLATTQLFISLTNEGLKPLCFCENEIPGHRELLLENCNNIQQLSEDVDLFLKKLFIIPVLAHNHWMLALVINPIGAFSVSIPEENNKKCYLIVLNSLRSEERKREKHIKYVLAEWMRKAGVVKKVGRSLVEDRIVVVHPANVPEQRNNNDCGPFVCYFVQKIMQSLKTFNEIDFSSPLDWNIIDPVGAPRTARQDVVDCVLEHTDQTTRVTIANEIGIRVTTRQ